ncbi:MAG TPA: hypothetical protein VHM91_01540, partial [Verrucomicrobiales bacterium]|nr:hypothetical protein [Verrucomicrobiales bacterium]
RLAGELARVAKEADRIEDLIESFEERRRNNRTSAVPLLSLAEIYRFLENDEARRTVLMEASRIAPDNKELRMEIIRTAEGEGDWDRAIELLRELAAGDASGAVSAKLAAMLFNAGREQEGLQLMASLMESGKLDARRAESMAASLASARSWTECAQFLASVVVKFPADYRLAYLLAVSLEESGDSAGALAAFRRLTAMKDELPGGPVRPHGPPPATSSTPANLTALRISTPAIALTLQTREAVIRLSPELDVFRQAAPLFLQAYKYKRIRGGLFSTVRSAAGSTAVPLPGSIEEVTFLALPHLNALSLDNGETRSAIIADLLAAGVPNADLLLETGNATTLGIVKTTELYQQNPGRPVLQVLLAASIIQSRQGDPPVIVELAGKLRTSRPDLAGMLIMTLASRENHAFADLCFDAVREALARIESDPSSRLAVISLLAGSAQTSSGEMQTLRLNPRLEALLYPQMTVLYRSTEPNDPLRSTLFPAIQTRYVEKKDYAKLVELLEIEMARGNTSQPSPVVRTSASRNLIAGVKFPSVGTDLPQAVASSVVAGPDYLTSSGSVSRYTVKRVRPSPDEIRALLPPVKDPVLRVLLAWTTGDKEMTATHMAALKSAGKLSFTGALLLAGWLEEEGRSGEVMEVLKRVPQPLAPVDQLRVDGYLTFRALESVRAGKSNGDERPAVVEAGQEAARRMQKANLSVLERKSLAAALEELGMKEEAARYPASQNPRTTARTRTVQNNKGRAEALLAAGRKPEAMRLLVKELRDWSQTWIVDKGAVTSTEMTKFKDGVIRLNLTDELLKASDPGETTDAGALALRGAALEILRGAQEAVDWYRRALAAKPKNAGVFSLLLRAALQNDPKSTGSILKGADPAMLPQAAATLARMDRLLTSIDARTSALEGLGEWLEALDPESLRSADLRWASLWVSTLSVSDSSNETRKVANPAGADTNQSEEERRIRQRWYDASQKVDVLLMKNERSALSAFTSYISKRLSFEPKADRSVPDRMVREILERREALKKSGKPMTEARYYWLPASNTAFPQNLSAGEWILQSAILEKKPEMAQDIVHRLKKAGSATDAALMETVARLHFCPPAEFAEAAKTASEFPREGNAMLERIVVIMGERKLSADLDTQVLGAVRDGTQSGRAAEFVLSNYCLHLRRSQGYKAAETFFAKATECYLGPSKDRAAFFAREYVPAKTQTGTPAGPVYTWLRLAGTLAGEPELSLLMLSALESEFSVHTGQRIEDSRPNGPGMIASVTFYRRPPDTVMQAFRGTPAFAEPGEFNLPMITGRYGMLIVTDMIDSMTTSGNVEQLRAAFAAEPQTFGTGFMRAAIDESPADALLTLAGTRLDALKKLPLERQQRIASLFEAALAGAGKSGEKTEAIKQGKDWLKSAKPREAF